MGPFAAVLLLRFLLEPLLAALPALLLPGGIVVLRGFHVPEKEPGDRGAPDGAPARGPRIRHGLPTLALQSQFDERRWELLRPPTEEVEGGRRWVGLVARVRP